VLRVEALQRERHSGTAQSRGAEREIRGAVELRNEGVVARCDEPRRELIVR